MHTTVCVKQSVMDTCTSALREFEKHGFEFSEIGYGGNGDQTALTLSEEEDVKDEKYTIDVSDTELETYLKNLNPAAVIFLNSCSNGEGEKEANSLANFIIKIANGRRVIASSQPFGASMIRFKSFYPFDIELPGYYSNK